MYSETQGAYIDCFGDRQLRDKVYDKLLELRKKGDNAGEYSGLKFLDVIDDRDDNLFIKVRFLFCSHDLGILKKWLEYIYSEIEVLGKISFTAPISIEAETIEKNNLNKI